MSDIRDVKRVVKADNSAKRKRHNAKRRKEFRCFWTWPIGHALIRHIPTSRQWHCATCTYETYR